jgi:hypothetical protein
LLQFHSSIRKATFYILFSAVLKGPLYAQSANSGYPKTTGYISFVNPVGSLDKNGGSFNFTHSYSGGFPCGINILKSDRSGFSFEVTPFINVSGKKSKMSNFLFHPGVMFRYPKGFTFIARMAFETAGRYGVTAVFNKVVVRTKMNNFFVAVPVPVRFGNDKPPSIGLSVQAGITF